MKPASLSKRRRFGAKKNLRSAQKKTCADLRHEIRLTVGRKKGLAPSFINDHKPYIRKIPTLGKRGEIRGEIPTSAKSANVGKYQANVGENVGKSPRAKRPKYGFVEK